MKVPTIMFPGLPFLVSSTSSEAVHIPRRILLLEMRSNIGYKERYQLDYIRNSQSLSAPTLLSFQHFLVG